jgi:protein-S-isoprenylcysteine O-methyltransferase Ste14
MLRPLNMNKLNFMGIGPKVGIIVLPWLAIAIFLTMKFRSSFAYFADANSIMFYSGLALVIAGSVLYLLTIPALLKGLKHTKLITNSTYYLCCNPLYASIILLIIPGASLMMNSWLILTTSLVGYVLMKLFIKSEYEEMERFFGEDFKKYRNETPEFFPFPVKKWLRSV